MVEVAGSLGEQLGAALRTERFLRSTSQRALALELGVSKSFIGRLESGDLRGSAATVAQLVERLGLAFAIVVPDEDLGGAMVDDSPEARDLAERWRRSDSARRDDLGVDPTGARHPDRQTFRAAAEPPPQAAPTARAAASEGAPGRTTRPAREGRAAHESRPACGDRAHEDRAHENGAVNEHGPAREGRRPADDDRTAADEERGALCEEWQGIVDGGPVGVGGPADVRGPVDVGGPVDAGDPIDAGGSFDAGGSLDQDGTGVRDHRPSWLLSSRSSLEELTVPGRPPPERAGRRVVVGIPAAQRSLRLDRFYDDPVAQVIAAHWQRRAETERVRDAAGRRMPAHVVCFPIQLPRTWWSCRHIAWDWRKRPTWSWRRRPLWVVEVLMTGANPPPVGAHPFGGYPMQGHPSEDVRGDWPPDPSLRAGRPPHP